MNSEEIESKEIFCYQIASDLHIEFQKGNAGNNWDELQLIMKYPAAKVLALLGDIGVLTDIGCQERYKSFVEWCSHRFSKVLLITGNHEYYNCNDSRLSMDDVDAFLSNFVEAHNTNRTNAKAIDSTLEIGELIFLNNKTIYIDGVVFIGSTLWSKVPNEETAIAIEGFLRDYKVIYNSEYKPITAMETNALFEHNIQWITEELSRCAEAYPSSPIVVLTHHTPSMMGTSNPIYEGRPAPECYINSGFSSDCDEVIANAQTLRCWCYGHTHYNNRHKRNNVLLLSNQHGYIYNVDSSYEPNLSLTVDLKDGVRVVSQPPVKAPKATAVERKGKDSAASQIERAKKWAAETLGLKML